MTLDACYNHYKGLSVNVDGNPADTGQCVQWADVVLAEVYGMVTHYGNAIDWWNDPRELLDEGFERINDGSIKYGDFVVFNTQVGSKYGHIDVAMEDATTGNFLGSDSNWGGNLTVHLVRHSNPTFVLGSLRLKKGADMTVDKYLATKLWEAYFVREPENDGVLSPIVGKDINDVIAWFESQPERARVSAKVHADESQAQEKLDKVKSIVD